MTKFYSHFFQIHHKSHFITNTSDTVLPLMFPHILAPFESSGAFSSGLRSPLPLNLQISSSSKSDGTGGGIKEFLSSIDSNIKDLDYVNENVRVTFPAHYDIVKYYVETYYKFLQPLILAQLDASNVPTQ
eukprot:61786_1